MTYARKNIAEIAGYTPGEQPQGQKLVKLNTNENPYPPSPMVQVALRDFDYSRLRLYSEPSARMVREAAASAFGIVKDNIICGNGSDDLLTIALRTFVDQGGKVAFTTPSYSLYPVLGQLQGSQLCPVELDDDFQLPDNAAQLAEGATLFLLCRPNAPTGNSFPKARMEKLCREFAGVVWIDEAYADFASDNCLDLVNRFPNVVVSRTLSKSYSLAGLRLGLAFSTTDLIAEMNKVKDSYNVDMLAQHLAAAALRDAGYMRENAQRIRQTRLATTARLRELGCTVLPSETNFLFVRPPKPAAGLFKALRDEGYLVRYFNLPRVSEYLRVTIGTETEMQGFIETMARLLAAE